MGGRGVRDPVPDIREIITDRKEAGGLPSSTFLNLAPEKQEKLLSAAVREFTERPYNEASIQPNRPGGGNSPWQLLHVFPG